jgi:alpha-beta hydrolase superfamily lysophospholipase
LRTTEAIVTSLGYPYEAYDVVTEDGYILRLERLPKKDSTKVLYFQHGVVDNSFAWFGHTEGETGSALAFRAFDSGYDIWVGSLRGCGSSMSHSNKDLPYHEYWNFTVNEHAFEDLPAFVRKIREVKDAELSAAKLSEMDDPAPTPGESQSELSPQYNLTFVAHSVRKEIADTAFKTPSPVLTSFFFKI